jgi:hypothetical protein
MAGLSSIWRSKMSLSEIDKRQNINLNSGLDDGNNKSGGSKYIIANPAKFEMYKLRIRR